MGLALVIFIAAYLKMSTHQKYYYQTLLHTVLYSPPLPAPWHYTLKIFGLNMCFLKHFSTVFEIFHDHCAYAVFLRMQMKTIKKYNRDK